MSIPKKKWTNAQYDFVGDTFVTREGNILKVVGVDSIGTGGVAVFIVTCNVCVKQRFKSNKTNLVKGSIPCNCGSGTKKRAKYFIGTTFTTHMGGVLTVLGINSRDKYGKAVFDMHCSICSNDTEQWPEGSITCTKKTLDDGITICGCLPLLHHNQKQSYIHLLTDEGITNYIKFGISSNSARRLTTQNRKSSYNLSCYGVWEYPSVSQCKDAERTVMRTLTTGLVSKRDLPDGYTETCSISDLDKVIAIYESFGGIRIDTTITNKTK